MIWQLCSPLGGQPLDVASAALGAVLVVFANAVHWSCVIAAYSKLVLAWWLFLLPMRPWS